MNNNNFMSVRSECTKSVKIRIKTVNTFLSEKENEIFFKFINFKLNHINLQAFTEEAYK